MLKIVKNPNDNVYQEITQAVKDNGGYCPCMITKTADTKCPCKVFREQSVEGECHCGRYVKVEVNDK